MRQSVKRRQPEISRDRQVSSKRSLLSRIFQDNTDKYVVGQPPNVPVVMVIVSVIASMLAPTGSAAARFFSLAAFGSVFLWAYLEIRYGESLFRRILGIVVLISLFVLTLR